MPNIIFEKNPQLAERETLEDMDYIAFIFVFTKNNCYRIGAQWMSTEWLKALQSLAYVK